MTQPRNAGPPADNAGPPANGFTLTNSYALGLAGEQVTETGGDGQWLHTNVFVGGQLLATYDDAGVHFHITDWLGSRRVQTNYLGQVEATYQNLPFGEMVPQNNTVFLGATEQHFTGKERDTESGNDYFLARYYNSATGRFLSPDWSAKVQPVPYAKLDNPQTLNLYGYMQNNPLGGVDQDGHCDWCQKLWNGITGNGFQTNAQIAAANAPTTVTTTQGDGFLVDPGLNLEPQPNGEVDLGTSAVGVLSAAPGVVLGAPGLMLGLAAGGVSSANDPSALNLSINGAGGILGVASYVGEGTAVGTGATVAGVGVAVGAMAWSASNWVSTNVITPVFTPDANQSDTINANGVTVQAPDAYDWHQP